MEVAVDADHINSISFSPLSDSVATHVSSDGPLYHPAFRPDLSDAVIGKPLLSRGQPVHFSGSGRRDSYGTGQSHGKLMRKIRTIIYGREQGQKIPSIGGIFCPVLSVRFLTQSYGSADFHCIFINTMRIMINIPDNREAAADTYHGFSRILSGIIESFY